MSEWVSVLAVFWALWAMDGGRLGPRRIFTLVGCIGWQRRSALLQPTLENSAKGSARAEAPCISAVRARVSYSRLSLPGWGPGSWRMTVEDVPLSLSPVGVCNRPAGATGRPAEQPLAMRVWRWDEVKQVGIAGGWIFVNGARFFPDTGHVTARELLALAQMDAPARENRIRGLLSRWLRPAHLRRRVRVLRGRTRASTALNVVTAAGFAILTIYIVGDLAARIPARWSAALGDAAPVVLLGLFTLHVMAVVLAWRAVRHLKAVRAEKRGANLFSAMLLPPQALRLRALAGEGFFPPQHPLAAVLAFGSARAQRERAFNVLADLRWPLPESEDTPLAREVAVWFRAAMEKKIVLLLGEAGIATEELLATPAPDTPASCAYCPRCRDQFVVGLAVCPHGVQLQPLRVRRV